MPLPRPASPRAVWRDLRAFAAERKRHQWAAALLAAIVPAAILYIFVLDSNTGLEAGPRLTFVESWPANRSDAEIKAQQKLTQEQRAAAEAERRRQWKALGDRLGM
ncbi:hypothetical protein [Allosphingosinicella sp.]|jgi:hypothetical protein|uniref:hypothetical protein n=1 Tax=Allosphingosinicella sp. TaxID=2823234 RepID=UPI002F0E3880